MRVPPSRRPGVSLLVLAAVVLSGPLPLIADSALVPVVARVRGQYDASWETEIRVTNRTDTPKRFSIVDWIGVLGWQPSEYVVAPHSTLSLGGFDAYGARVSNETGAVGLAICEAERGLLVQSAVLSGIWTGGGGVSYACPSYDGGGGQQSCLGLPGAGPVLAGLAFASPGQETYLPWLHTDDSRRTNLVLINPDPEAAHVRVSVVSQDGGTTVVDAFDLPARSYSQIDDFFSRSPWSALRVANHSVPGVGGGAAASATITSDRRILAMAYVIGQFNNSLTVSVPW